MVLALVGLAFASGASLRVAAPTITLDLDQAVLKPNPEYKGSYGYGCAHDGSFCRSKHSQDTQKHPSWETKYIHECRATDDNKHSCPLPKAKAFDHHEGDLTNRIHYTCYIVNNDGRPVPENDQQMCNDENCIDYSKRSEWLTKYDVKDTAGNSADSVLFATVVIDHKAPVFDKKLPKLVGEAHFDAEGKLPLAAATDNVDKYPDVKVYPPSVPLSALKTYEAAWEACDRAGVFGKDGKNNCRTKKFKYEVKDTTKPTIDVNATVKELECQKSPGVKGSLMSAFSPICDDTFDKTVKCMIRCPKCGFKVGQLRDDFRFSLNRKRSWTFDFWARDKSGNAANTRLKVLRVIDKKAPTVVHNTIKSKALRKLTADESIVEHNIGMDRENFRKTMTAFKTHDWGFQCEDQCDKKPHGSYDWVTEPLGPDQELKVGTYIMKYTCEDHSNNKASFKRTIINVDKLSPVLNFPPGAATYMTFQANKLGIDRTKYSTKQWAPPVCKDLVDGKLWVGDEVTWNGQRNPKVYAKQLAKGVVLGTYKVEYFCKDKSGNWPPKRQVRTIIIKDDEGPKCTAMKPAFTCEASSTCLWGIASLAKVKCTDNHDDNSDIRIRRVGHVSLKKVGKYNLYFYGIDQAGNKGKPVKVEVSVVDTSPPEIMLEFHGKKLAGRLGPHNNE
jgi:hypothetical protein